MFSGCTALTELDLSGFDTLALAENVAQFPIPIITGIGHDRDESILDMVSHTRVKTPTAAAAFLIENLKRVADRIEDARQRIPVLALQAVSNSRHRVEMAENRLTVAIDRNLTSQKHRLENLAILLQGFDPQLLLKRGYSITLHNGRAVRNPALLHPGDEIETRVEKGTIKSTVKQ